MDAGGGVAGPEIGLGIPEQKLGKTAVFHCGQIMYLYFFTAFRKVVVILLENRDDGLDKPAPLLIDRLGVRHELVVVYLQQSRIEVPVFP